MTDAWIDPRETPTPAPASEQPVSTQARPGSQYEPRHIRTLHVNNQAEHYVARAIQHGIVIAEVVGKNRYEAMDKLADTLRPLFRAMR